MKNIMLIIILLLLFGTISGQSAVADLKEAEDLFQRKSYAQVVDYYMSCISKKNANGNIYYKAGICYLNSRSQKTKAAPLFEKAIEQSTSFYTHALAKESDAPMDVYFYLGEAYRYQLRFDDAIKAYQKYIEKLRASKTDDELSVKKTLAGIQACEFENEIKEAFLLPPNIKLNELYGISTKPVGEFSTELSKDKSRITYTIKVPLSAIKKSDDEKFFEYEEINADKIDSGAKTGKIKPVKLNRDTIVNITTVGTSVDGQFMLTYKNDAGEANLYLQRLNGNEWSKPNKLPKIHNTAGWEPDECVCNDGSTMYFVSSRAGGYGGKDLYYCKKLSNGKWSRAKNLGPEINSIYDEEAPFMHSDGLTLYYSSNKAHPSASYDIYTSTRTTTGWTKSLAVGYPINSSEEDLFYQVSNDKKKLLASSNNSLTGNDTNSKKENTQKSNKSVKKIEDSLKKKIHVQDEQYLVSFEGPSKNNMVILKAQVTEKKDQKPVALPSKVYLINNTNGKVLIEQTTDSHGRFCISIPPDINCAVRIENTGYLFSSLNFSLHPAKNYYNVQPIVILQPLAPGSSCTLSNVVFEDEKSQLQSSSLPELERLYELLSENSGLEIKLYNYVQSSKKSHRQLSTERAETVKKYLTEKGIDDRRIRTKGERESLSPQQKKDAEKNGKAIQSQVLELKITAINNYSNKKDK